MVREGDESHLKYIYINYAHKEGSGLTLIGWVQIDGTHE